ncbi:methylated-DNA-[protein]-cysteine S-methyltransferase [Natronoarchaeum philippinense]|uniref:Methylated-DNA-[protein]-cysteine S-methyltransferase n=1 Tax=Natronoarchaeum philippinense TaxID=558529 RepID=A0A285NZ27_NATPI|nr:MGMT family protein [Natronoarchaeum philippinense]SNZ13156.1 methylated-DNA-[protein]-cysteine S-methyltransferase [Natronoarchaeum philippinense]
MNPDDAGIYARDADYLDRAVQLGVASGKVLRVTFPDAPDADATPDHPLLDRIEDYLTGVEEADFADVQVALTVPTDQRKVLETVRDVPYGESITVAAVARMTPNLNDDEEADIALVRTALAENPAPLLIPDHRISDGPSAAPPPVEQRLRSIEGL